MIFVVVLIAALIFGILAWLFLENLDSFVLYMIACIVAIVLAIVGIIQGLCFFSGLLTYEADCAAYAATREVYIDELRHYDEMRDTDVTASSTYLELREKIIDFNYNVDFAKQRNNIWLRHAIVDPAYATVDTIDIGVG